MMLNKDTLENYQAAHQIEWANTLPEGCPPENILIPENEEFYRLTIEPDKVTEDDFKTYVELFPQKTFKGQLAIFATGLSVLSSDNPQGLLKLPGMEKFKGVAKLTLTPKDGVMMKSGGKPYHYTWWRTTAFDIQSAVILNNEDA